ncbi:MAG: hypothetical protein PHH01_01550 [Patescibacteria group bacterium]|nr:hypothetical protein [Patescibacteria group bacterium]
MSKYFFLCKTNQQKYAATKRPSLFQCLSQKPKTLNIALLVLIIVLGLAYLVQVNRTATSGFAIDSLNKDIKDLQESSQKMELQVADLQSLQKIQAATERLQLVARTKLEYLEPTQGAVALER